MSGTDTYVYVVGFERTVSCRCVGATSQWEFAFQWSTVGLALVGVSAAVYLGAIALVTAAAMARSIFIVGKHVGLESGRATINLILAASLLLALPFTHAEFTNVLRSGIAIPLIAIGAVRLWESRVLLATAWFVVAALVQFPTTVGAVLGLLVVWKLSRNSVLALTLVAFSAYVTGLSEAVGRSIDSATGGRLLVGLDEATRVAGDSYRSGTRLDFAALALCVLVLLFAATQHSKVPGLNSLFAIAAGTSLSFFCIGYSAYSDRWLLTLWFVATVGFAACATCRLPVRVSGVVTLAAIGVALGGPVWSLVAF